MVSFIVEVARMNTDTIIRKNKFIDTINRNKLGDYFKINDDDNSFIIWAEQGIGIIGTCKFHFGIFQDGTNCVFITFGHLYDSKEEDFILELIRSYNEEIKHKYDMPFRFIVREDKSIVIFHKHFELAENFNPKKFLGKGFKMLKILSNDYYNRMMKEIYS